MKKQITQMMDLFFFIDLEGYEKKKIKKALPMFDLQGSAY